MNKISNAQMAEVLSDAATTLRAQQAYIGELEEKLASKETRERVEKLASAMHQKGLELDVTVSDLADCLEKAAEQQKLDVIEEAVNLTGPDMGSKLASLTHDVTGGSSGSTDLERYIVGHAG